ncbi:hypothetical protein K432DRAFT_206706 [Lepidopterella palustris CBS 459.81]|uniref:Uncharacterized protein n=1 Tax=Lepidopterella palustris CBS 459.81 TaxID=1314670 RepID=A0A8E2EF28_9PEZI|nr:hypothetical protein K432DRAFT_206706 [Lepidopterella palustris CBS 459.81]
MGWLFGFLACLRFCSISTLLSSFFALYWSALFFRSVPGDLHYSTFLLSCFLFFFTLLGFPAVGYRSSISICLGWEVLCPLPFLSLYRLSARALDFRHHTGAGIILPSFQPFSAGRLAFYLSVHV